MKHDWRDLKKPWSGLLVQVCADCGARHLPGVHRQVHNGVVTGPRDCPGKPKST